MEKLTDFYPFDGASDLTNKLLLCIDRPPSVTSHAVYTVDGDFVFTILLLKLIKQGKKIMIISCKNGRSHYDLIFKRFSVDLNRLETSGQIVFKFLVLNSIDGNSVDTSIINWGYFDQWVSDGLLFSPNNNGDKYSLLIDDLEIFDLMAPNKKASRNVISTVHDFLNTKIDLIILRGHDMEYNVLEEEGEPSLTEYSKNRAELTITISGLTTGFSSEVHGFLHIAATDGLLVQMMNFKALDSAVYSSIIGSKVNFI